MYALPSLIFQRVMQPGVSSKKTYILLKLKTMTWNSIMGIVSSAALFLPICCIIVFRMVWYRSFSVLIVYYSSILIYNLLTEGYLNANHDLIYYWGLVNNLLDAPLILLFLTYFSPSKKFTKGILILIFSFILFEILIISIAGLNTKSITIILGPGLMLVFGVCLFYFFKFAKLAVEHKKYTGKALIISSLLFAYGCYSIIYLIYYIFKSHVENGVINQQIVKDTFLIYFFATTISGIIMCVGLIFERIRIHKLYELKITRKELSSIYTETKMAVPIRTAMLDFDKNH